MTCMPADAPPDDDDDDDIELELEAVDPEILEHERQRAQRKTDEAIASINPDELFPDANSEGLGLGIDWESWKQFRFTTRHLLILTAMLAMVMTLFKAVANPCSGVFILGVVALAAGWWWVMRQERQHALERARRREEFFGATGAATIPAVAVDPGAAKWRPEFSFSFSMKELFGAMTAAAVLMAIMAWLGPEKMALLLGLIALAGVVLLMVVDVPRVVVLAWWILLLLYLAVGGIAALRGKDDQEAALRRAACWGRPRRRRIRADAG